VGFPGPSGVAWGVELLVWAFAAVVLGELVRRASSRWVTLWRRLDPIERGVLDLYLGGAVVYLVAAVPAGAFDLLLVTALPVVAGLLLLAWLFAKRSEKAGTATANDLASLLRPAPLIVLLSAFALFAVELWLAVPVGSGNTYDSSLLTLYTSLLVQNHQLPLSFQPYATPGILYPQGTTAWLGWAQLMFGLPPARTALLVTPLFLGVAPLGGYVLGRRWFGSERAGVAVALMLAWIGPGTRAIVGASNDFVFAFPLLLVLAGQSAIWLRSHPPAVPDAIAWGVLLGYSAALNPVGAEVLLPGLLIAGLIARPRFGAAFGPWLGRWGAAVIASLLAVVPSLYVLAEGWRSPSFVPGTPAPPPGTGASFTIADLIGRVDPYLFGPRDTAISPVPFLVVEFAVLLTVGFAILLFTGRGSPLGRYLETGRILLASLGASTIGFLLIFALTPTGFRPAIDITNLSNPNELSTWLFNLYAVVAAVPLALLLERWSAPVAPSSPEMHPASPYVARRWTLDPIRDRFRSPRAGYALAIAGLIVVPGVALTTTALPPVLSQLYQDFGNLTTADFDLLEFAGAHVPSGARVLVAPGSAAEFLPGYARDVVLLYPQVPGWSWINASYKIVVRELTNATLNASGTNALTTLRVGYVAVTGWNTVLWPPFSPAPLLADPSAFPLLFHEDDAYLFGYAAPAG
jgi:hypothetical protein